MPSTCLWAVGHVQCSIFQSVSSKHGALINLGTALVFNLHGPMLYSILKKLHANIIIYEMQVRK